jgi:hypothetical protein
LVRINTKGVDLEKYIQEGLLALLPRYQGGAGRTVIFTLKGSYPDPRGVPWLVKRLASYYSLNLPELRRHCGKLLGLRHYISLPLSEGLVLLPAKVRQAAQPGETTTGFINLLQVKEILPPAAAPSRAAGSPGVYSQAASSPGASSRVADSPGVFSPKTGSPAVSYRAGETKPAWLSRVLFKCGLQLKTLNTLETMNDRLRQGEIVLQDYHRRQKQGATFTGLSRQVLLGQLPNCSCILKDFFIGIFRLKPDE